MHRLTAHAPHAAASPAAVLQRKCACGSAPAGLGGKCSECERRQALGLQARLAVGPVDDPLEREADAVADQVLRPGVPAGGAAPRLQRATARSGAADGRGAGAGPGADTLPASVGAVLATGGQPLAPALRSDMEQRFGHDFSQVRVHADALADRSAREVQAHAYTVGRHVAFAAGRFDPHGSAGRRLLAHELAHVVQQSPAGAPAALQRSAVGTLAQPMPFGEMPMPRVGPMPGVRPLPMPGARPMPPIVVPRPGEAQPEIEVEELPEAEELDEAGDGAGPDTEPDSGPNPQPGPQQDAKPEPGPGPQPLPPVGPQPPEGDADDRPDRCGSERMPFTQVTSSTGPLGQGGTVRASPLTRCPPPGMRGSQARRSTYPVEFACVKKAKQSRIWLPVHLLHGQTRRTGARNLHGPGNMRWNIVIGDATLNRNMYAAVEGFVVNRVYDWNQVLWLESRVEAYFPGAETFAKRVRMSWGLYDTRTKSEVSTIGGGTFESVAVPPPCAPGSPAGAPALQPGAAGGFDSTLRICLKSLRSRTFPLADGGLELTLRTGNPGADCGLDQFKVTLWKLNKHWIDGDFGGRPVPSGKAVRLRWRNLPQGDYYLVFEVGAHKAGCCLQGDVSMRAFPAGPDLTA